MSGIAGCIHWNAQELSKLSLEKMAEAINHRGHSSIHLSSCKEAGFVQISQGIKENQGRSDSRYIVTFHGRIDNCSEIYYQINPAVPLSSFVDSTICLEAYKRWGEKCATKLVGDFAFTVWDDKKKSLYCCRDHMGVKPFYYIATPSFFAFASEIKALLTLPEVGIDINEERIADYLVCFVTEQISTFFKNIYRLQPAHYLIVDRFKKNENRYWILDKIKLSNLSFEEHSEQFFHLLREAVRTRLPKSGTVGSFLSGGIDSSSIVCMSTGCLSGHFKGKFHTFSHIYDRLNDCDERRYFQPILDKYEIASHFISGDEVDPASAFESTAAFEDEPFEGPHFFASWYLLHFAREAGIHTLFDGHDGDSILSLGVGLFPELARQGKIVKLYSEILACNPKNHKMALTLFFKLYRDLLHAKIPFLNYRSSFTYQKADYLRFLNANLLYNTNVLTRINEMISSVPLPLQTEQQRHFNNIFQPFHSNALEFLERLSSGFGICSCFPYFDIRLIEFCLSLPAEHKLRKGYNRAYVRQSLRGILPEKIEKRKDKTYFVSNLFDAYLIRGKEWFEYSYHDIPNETFQYVDKEQSEKLFKKCMDRKNGTPLLSDLHKMIRLFSLAKWLKKISER